MTRPKNRSDRVNEPAPRLDLLNSRSAKVVPVKFRLEEQTVDYITVSLVDGFL